MAHTDEQFEPHKRKIDELGREVERLGAQLETLLQQRDDYARENRELRFQLSQAQSSPRSETQ
jgi:prefoldin subunit 5